MKRPATAVLFAVALVVFIALVSPRALQIESLKERSRRLEKELTYYGHVTLYVQRYRHLLFKICPF